MSRESSTENEIMTCPCGGTFDSTVHPKFRESGRCYVCLSRIGELPKELESAFSEQVRIERQNIATVRPGGAHHPATGGGRPVK